VEKLLAIKGEAARGRQVFFGAGASGSGTGALCAQCHRVGEEGETFGPDLTHVGTKLDRRKLLESMLEPSKTIEPQYLTYVVRTKKGEDHSGLIVEKTAKAVILRDAQRKDVRIPEADIKRFVPHPLSMMPDGLLAGLTPQQAADLLEFLASRK
jgi:putative heme-binding domain-containing protein